MCIISIEIRRAVLLIIVLQQNTLQCGDPSSLHINCACCCNSCNRYPAKYSNERYCYWQRRNKPFTTRWWYTTAVSSDIDSARTFLNLHDAFKKLSGLTINLSKREGMWIGSSKKSELRPFGITRRGEQIKALRVYYTYDMKLVHEKNSKW